MTSSDLPYSVVAGAKMMCVYLRAYLRSVKTGKIVTETVTDSFYLTISLGPVWLDGEGDSRCRFGAVARES